MSSDQPDAGGDDPALPLPTTDGASDHPVLGELDDSSDGSGDSGDSGDGPGMPDEPLPLSEDSGTELKTFRDLLLPFGSSSSGGGDSTVSGGYRFSPEELSEILDQWKDIQRDLEKDLDHAEKLTETEAPGHEFASGEFVKGANTSGQAYYELHNRMLEYVEQYIEKLEDAKQAIESEEGEAVEAAAQAGKGLE